MDTPIDFNPLPDNNDPFWTVGKEKADNAVHELRKVTCAQHTFKRSGSNAECDCGLGYMIGIGADVRDGHIYIKNELVI